MRDLRLAVSSRITLQLDLLTDRLLLKPVGEDDSSSLKTILTNEYVRKYLFDNKVLSDVDIQGFISTSIRTFREQQFGLWLLLDRKTVETIGVAGLWRFFEEAQPQLLYALLPRYLNRGYATEASIRLVRYAFSSLSFSYLDASCDADNQESHRVALRIGMKEFRKEVIGGSPLVFFRITRDGFTD